MRYRPKSDRQRIYQLRDSLRDELIRQKYQLEGVEMAIQAAKDEEDGESTAAKEPT